MLPDPVETPTLDVEQAAKLLGIGRTLAYSACRQYLRGGGGIPAIRIGRSIRVPTHALLQMLRLTPDAERPGPDSPATPAHQDPRLQLLRGGP